METQAEGILASYVDDEEEEDLPLVSKPTWLEEMAEAFKPQNLIAALMGGSITGVIGVTASIAFASLIFSGELAPYAPTGIGFLLFGGMIMATTSSLFSSASGVIAGVQDTGVAVLSVAAIAVIGLLPPGTASETMFVTVAAVIMGASVLTGLVFLLLGFLRLGDMIRFIPYPVIGGFLSGSGLLLVKGAITLMTGTALVPSLTQPELITHWLPGLLFAVALIVIMKRISHFLILPGLIAASIAIFFAILAVTGTPMGTAAQLGWLMNSMPEGGLWHPINLAELSRVDWSIVVGQAGSLLSAAVVLVISLLLGASGIELEVQKDIDLNHELKILGVANLLAALVASPPGGPYLGSTALVHRMKAGTRLAGVLQSILTAVVLFAGASLLLYFPIFVLGGLVMYFGLTFMLRWVVDARKELPTMDYVIVLLILGVIFAVGFLPGIAVGIVLAVILFVVNYSRINVIKHALSGANHQSTVERPELYRDLLRKKGHWLYMVKLQGFIFFGTANSLFNQFRSRIEDRDQQRPRYFLLDFHQVTGVDSSAMLSFQKMLQYAKQQNVVILFTALSPVMEKRLSREPFVSERNQQWRSFDDLDHGMEWYEDQVISDFESVGFGIKPPTMTRRLVKVLDSRKSAAVMQSYLRRIEMEGGEVVIERGDPPCGMYFIEEGQVTVRLQLHDERWIRIRTMSSGTVIGELSYYLDIPATARVVAEGKVVLFFLSIESLKEMSEKNPDISTAFHKFMANTIAERLVSANDTMKVLLD